MKKMQCEVCGSNEIMKVSDGIFECQSCGVRYSTEEVQKLLVEITGSVKIDHSDEIQNAIARAEQFNDEGNIDKAEEYYNKALDMDAENETAQKEVQKIKKSRNKPTNLYYLPKNKDSSKVIETFLKLLKDKKNIVPDIYKEIEIMSVTEKYYPFAVIDGSYYGDYSGTACYRREVKYTDWETYTDYVNGKPVKRRKPVTKTRIEIDKQPASGKYSTTCWGIYSVSKEFNDYFSSVTPGKFDKHSEADSNEIIYAKERLLLQLENYLDIKYDKYSEKTQRIDIDNLTIEISDDGSDIDTNWSKRATKIYDKKVWCEADGVARKCVGGDFTENVNCNCYTEREDTTIIYLPFEIIKYVYKGDVYLCVVILNSSVNEFNIIYPYYVKIDSLDRKGSNEVQATKSKGYYGAWAWMIGAFALFMVLCFGSGSYIFKEILMSLAYTNFGLGAFLTILGLVKLSKANKIKNEYIRKIQNVSQINKNELIKEFEVFFKNFDGIESIVSCNEAVKKTSNFSCPDSEVVSIVNDPDNNLNSSCFEKPGKKNEKEDWDNE